MKQKLFLIGFMGAGKSTLGKAVSQSTDCDFVDTDILIEQEQNRSIPQIFAENGEQFFRELETNVLKTVCDNPYTLVVATGGGIVENPANLELMLSHGFVVFIHTPLEMSLERIQRQKNRPLASKNGVFQPDNLKERFQKRLPLYTCAHCVFMPTGNVAVDATEIGLLWKNFKK